MRKQNLQGKTVPAVGEGKRGEQGYIGYLLGQAYAAHRIRMEKALVDQGITLPQFSVLTMLAAYPGASGADLARLALLTPQTMSVIVSNLERDGMVTRQPHPVHGRIQLIDITAEGRALLAQCKHLVQPIGQSLTAGLGAEEEKIVRRWLVEIAQGGVV